MEGITLAAFVDLLMRQSASGLFVVFVYALLKGWIVVGKTHHETVNERDERYEEMLRLKDEQIKLLTLARDRWERIALRALNISEKTVEMAEHGRREGS